MTDEERAKREREWVSARFDCTVENVFKALVAIVDSDLTKFKEISGKDLFALYRVDDRPDVVDIGIARNGVLAWHAKIVSVSVDRPNIRVETKIQDNSLSEFRIVPKWNEHDMKCDLYIDDEKVSLHRASQKIVGDMLFENLEG